MRIIKCLLYLLAEYCWISCIFIFATAATVRFGLNTSMLEYNWLVSSSLVVQQRISSGCTTVWRSIQFLEVRNITALTTLSFPCVRFLQFWASIFLDFFPLIWLTQHHQLEFLMFFPYYISHSSWNCFHATSLHFITYFCQLLQIFASSIDVTLCTGIEIVSHPRMVLFGVKGW